MVLHLLHSFCPVQLPPRRIVKASFEFLSSEMVDEIKQHPLYGKMPDMPCGLCSRRIRCCTYVILCACDRRVFFLSPGARAASSRRRSTRRSAESTRCRATSNRLVMRRWRSLTSCTRFLRLDHGGVGLACAGTRVFMMVLIAATIARSSRSASTSCTPAISSRSCVVPSARCLAQHVRTSTASGTCLSHCSRSRFTGTHALLQR